jgi:tRNA(adenine34) deaminase
MDDAKVAWSRLEAVWRECLELAWVSYGLGSIPVGAVLVDPQGNVVARGRNGVHEAEQPEGGLSKTRLAHAEVNALLKLDTGVRYVGYTLYSSLEPCLLCMGAAALATVDRVCYAGVDPSWGAAKFVLNTTNRPFGLDRLGFRIEGPLNSPFAKFAAALHVEFFLRNPRSGGVVTAYTKHEPGIVRIAERMRNEKISEASRDMVSLSEVFPLIWDSLM